jgi:hypothetical protein
MSHGVQTEKTNVPSSSALWAVLIFVGLIIAAINFVQAENTGEGHGGHGEAIEHHEAGADHEAIEGQAGHEATTEAAPAEGTAPAAATHDTAAHGEHQDTQAAPTHEEAHH